MEAKAAFDTACASCHGLDARGGERGPDLGLDLTSYATRMGADDIRSVIVNPNKDLDPRRGLVTVILADSTTLSGIARNEDNFSLQLQTPDGVFHLLNKSDIKDLTYTGRSAMPSDYGTILSSGELDDLVSYLLWTSRSASVRKAQSNREDRDEE